MSVRKSLTKGTILAGLGIGGWLLEQSIGYLGGILTSLAGVGGVELPPELAWMIGCCLGIVIGDLLSAFAGRDVAVGNKAGILKGIAASIGGIIGLVFGGGFATFVLGIWVPTVMLDLAGY